MSFNAVHLPLNLTNSMAKRFSAVLAMGAVIAVVCGARPFAFEANSHAPGCPLHSRPASSRLPSPLPVSHSCCETGHDAAIVQESANLKPFLPYSSAAFELSPAIPKNIAENFPGTTGFRAKPPGTLALRI
jgi:hypothetical protein